MRRVTEGGRKGGLREGETKWRTVQEMNKGVKRIKKRKKEKSMFKRMIKESQENLRIGINAEQEAKDNVKEDYNLTK